MSTQQEELAEIIKFVKILRQALKNKKLFNTSSETSSQYFYEKTSTCSYEFNPGYKTVYIKLCRRLSKPVRKKAEIFKPSDVLGTIIEAESFIDIMNN